MIPSKSVTRRSSWRTRVRAALRASRGLKRTGALANSMKGTSWARPHSLALAPTWYAVLAAATPCTSVGSFSMSPPAPASAGVKGSRGRYSNRPVAGGGNRLRPMMRLWGRNEGSLAAYLGSWCTEKYKKALGFSVWFSNFQYLISRQVKVF